MADVRQLAVDDVDSVIRAFHRIIQGENVPLLPGLTAEEKKQFQEKEQQMRQEPEKRELDQAVDEQVETERIVKKAKTNGLGPDTASSRRERIAQLEAELRRLEDEERADTGSA